MTQNETTGIDSVTQMIMYYFISRLNGVLGHTHLQKLLFLTDLLATQRFDEPITKMNYVRYNHGPYSKNLNDYIQKLVSSELVVEKRFSFYNNPDSSYYRLYDAKKADIKTQLYKTIGPEKTLLVDEVVQSYGNKSLQQVLDFVYSLEEVKDAKFDSPIRMIKEYGEKYSTDDEDIPF